MTLVFVFPNATEQFIKSTKMFSLVMLTTANTQLYL